MFELHEISRTCSLRPASPGCLVVLYVHPVLWMTSLGLQLKKLADFLIQFVTYLDDEGGTV